MAGPHDWELPTTTPVSTPNFGPPGTGGNNQTPQVTTPVSTGTPNYGPPSIQNPPPVDITEDINEGNFGLSLHGDEPYTPVYPGLGEEGGPTYDIIDIMTDISKTHGKTTLEGPAGETEQTKYGKSWDFNPNNPNNLIGMDTHTLGSFIAVDSSGNPVLDSEGKPIFTSLGQHVHDEMQDAGFVGPNQTIDPSMMPALQDFVKGLSYEDIHGIEDDFWRDYTAPGGGGGYEDYGYDYYGDRRDAKMDLLTALASGAPARDMEQSGFFDTLVDPYAEPQSEALQSGIFSGLMPGYTGEGMKRLLRSYGSGLQAPRYANVAKGGIVGLLGV